MRVSIIAGVLSSLAPAVSAHTVSCWGKSMHPPFWQLEEAAHDMANAIKVYPESPLGQDVHADKNSCHEIWCKDDVSIRFCNQNENEGRTLPLRNILDSVLVLMHDCVAVYEGETVAGGFVDHPDKWSVVVQVDDQCVPP